jgi:nicotinamide-nucleotide adenylyltransferase
MKSKEKMPRNTTRGLMIGRFQPFHNGHLSLTRQILKECDELIIVIGSAQFNYIYKDPFSAGERILMIHEALLESRVDLKKCYIIPIANDDNNSRWFAYLKSMVPPFNSLYSGNILVTNLTSSSSYKQIRIIQPHYERKREYNGTSIRRKIASGQKWKKFVPASVYIIIERINGEHRIRMLSASDSNPQIW